jgi:hypothetical protein
MPIAGFPNKALIINNKTEFCVEVADGLLCPIIRQIPVLAS